MLTNLTLIHEHMAIDLSGPKKDLDCRMDLLTDGLQEIADLKNHGVVRILDCSNRGMGRDLKQVLELEKQTNIQILFSTGYYKDPFLPSEVDELTVDQLADLMTKEITEGIEGLRCASVIGEIGTSLNVITPNEEKVFLAACIAHKKTGAPILTHTTLGTMGDQQVDLLRKHGVDLNRVLISHVDLKNDFDSIVRLLNSGVNVGFDTIGKNNYLPDETRLDWIVRLIDLGYIDQLFLSMDITRKSNLATHGGIGYHYLFDTFIPELKKRNITEDQLQRILSDNPNRFLGGNAV
ncbi:MAG: hypothetical protein JXK92_04045 [Erysipelotrichaceae bacterium]|nr:hypothetical protein [Erysipelotrichaceae bacterium]